jgi:hypothetical protein
MVQGVSVQRASEILINLLTTYLNMAIYKLVIEVQKSLNSKNQIGGIFCDLEKASDCVNHEVQNSDFME